jgi:hypothetical protein
MVSRNGGSTPKEWEHDHKPVGLGAPYFHTKPINTSIINIKASRARMTGKWLAISHQNLTRGFQGTTFPPHRWRMYVCIYIYIPARPHRFYQWNLPMIIHDSSCPIAAGSSLVVLPLAPEWAAQCSPAPPVRSHPWSRGVPLAGQALVEGSWSTKGELPLNSLWINGKGDNVR